MKEVVFTIFGIELTWEGIGIIIAAIFSVFSVIGNIINFFLKRKETKKNRSIQYVTNKRVEWMYAVRKEAAEFLSLVHTYGKASMIPDEAFERICEKIYILELYFNFEGIVDNVLISLMYDIIDDVKNHRSFNTNAQLFCNHLRIYLKVEWNRVKYEANGEKYTRERNISELCSAYKSYLEENQKIDGTKSIKHVKCLLEDNKKKMNV